MTRYVETSSGLTLLQRYQHHDQCVCPDMNEAPPPHAETCVYRRQELIRLICAIEAEARVDADWARTHRWLGGTSGTNPPPPPPPDKG